MRVPREPRVPVRLRQAAESKPAPVADDDITLTGDEPVVRLRPMDDAGDTVAPVELPSWQEVMVRSQDAAHFLSLFTRSGEVSRIAEDFLDQWDEYKNDPAVQQRWDAKQVESALAMATGLELRQKLRDSAALAEAKTELEKIRRGLQAAVWEKQLQSRFGAVPREFELVGPEGKVTHEVLERVYEVATLPEGGSLAVEPDDLVGIEIRLPADPRTEDAEPTFAYHRFSKDERRQLLAATREQPLTIGRPSRYTEHHLAITRDDLATGDLLGVSLKHLRFYNDQGMIVAIDSSSNHGAALVRRARSAEERVSERGVEWLKREKNPDLVVDLNDVAVTPDVQNDVARVARELANPDALIPRRVTEFNQWLSGEELQERTTRGKLREAIFRLENHAFSPVANPADLQQGKARLAALVHGLETAVNPQMARARVSEERKARWSSEAKAGGQRLTDLRRSLTEYRRLADKIDAAADLRALKLDHEMEITGDNGFRAAYDKTERKIADIGLGQEERAQLLEAYRRWLRDAIERLEDLGVA